MNISQTKSVNFGAKFSKRLETYCQKYLSYNSEVQELKQVLSTNNDDIITFDFKNRLSDFDNPKSQLKSMPCISMLNNSGERDGIVILNSRLHTDTGSSIADKIKKLLKYKHVLRKEIIAAEKNLKRFVKNAV